MKIILAVLLVFASACSKERVGSKSNVDIGAPVEERLEPKSTAACPLDFPKAGLCAKVQWTKTARSEEAGEFLLSFWDKSTGTENGPFVDPVQAPTTIFEMKCCHTPTAFALVRQNDGVYTAEVKNLAAGEYFHHIRLGKEAASESVTSDVVVE